MAEKGIPGNKKSRKCCSDWNAVSCRNNTSGNLVIINLQGLQVQGGIDMNFADRSRLQALKKTQTAAARRPVVENQRPGKSVYEPEEGDLLKDSFKLPSLEQHIAKARARCSEALRSVTAVEQRVVFRQQQMTQLQEKLSVAQQEAWIYKREAAYLQQWVGDLELANGRLEDLYEQLQRELEETKSRVQLQIKEAQTEALASFKQSQEFQDLVDSSCLKCYEGALNDVRARMALLFPAIDSGFLDSILDGDEPAASPLAAADRPRSEHMNRAADDQGRNESKDPMDQHDKVDGSGVLEQTEEQGKRDLLDEAGYLAYNQRSECCDWAAVGASNTSSGKVTVSNVQGLQLQGGVNMAASDGSSASTRKRVDQYGNLNDIIRSCSNWTAVSLTNNTTSDVVVNNSQGLQIQGGVEIKSAKTHNQQLLANEVHDEIVDVEGTTTDIKLRKSAKRSLQPDSGNDDPEPQLKRSRGNVNDTDTGSVISTLWSQILQPTTQERVNVLQQQLSQLQERLAAGQDMARRTEKGERDEISNAVNGTDTDQTVGMNGCGTAGKGVN